MIILAGKNIINWNNVLSIEIEKYEEKNWIKFYLLNSNTVKIFYKNTEDAVKELNQFYDSIPTHSRFKYKFKYHI